MKDRAGGGPHDNRCQCEEEGRRLAGPVRGGAGNRGKHLRPAALLLRERRRVWAGGFAPRIRARGCCNGPLFFARSRHCFIRFETATSRRGWQGSMPRKRNCSLVVQR